MIARISNRKIKQVYVLAIVFILFLSFLHKSPGNTIVYHDNAIQTHEASGAIKSIPLRLRIPKTHVDALIQPVGVTQAGVMDVPTNTTDVGWFDVGPIPGEKGSAVVAGHLNGTDGMAGVFINLHILQAGDRIYVEDEQKIVTTFVVRKIHTYDPGYAEEVFSTNDGVHLNLITCDGTWDDLTKNYSKRLVVFADLLK